MQTDILKQVNQEKYNFENKEITVVGGFTFNQKKMIEKIYRFYNSKFESGEVDEDGDRKFFFNVVKNPCKLTTKMIDFDTKNINVQTASGGNELTTWFFEKDLKFWMKDKGFGMVLNRIFDELPKFGSVVIKVVDNVPYFVDLRNFVVNEQSADSLDQASSVIEKHLYTPREFRKVGKKMGWKNVDEAIEKFYAMKRPYIAVYERYGDVEEINSKGETSYIYKRIYVADVGVDEVDMTGGTVPYPGLLLKEDEVDSHPYYEFHINKMSGRWLGVGVVEELGEVQIKQNEIANLMSKGSSWSALRIFQAVGGTGSKNLLTEVRNGEVVDTEVPITPIDMVDRNLAFFNQEYQKWMSNRDEISFSYDVVRGERLPSGTPLGSAQLAASMTTSYFDQIAENIALDVKKFLYDVILPNFEKEATAEHELRLVGEDLDKLRSVIISQKATDELFNYIIKNNSLPTSEQYETIKAGIGEAEKQEKEKLLTVPKNFYKDIKYKIDIVITGESKDSRTMTQIYFAALQAITADPTILTDPNKKKIFMKALEAGGVNPLDIIPDEPVPSAQQLMSEMMPTKGAGGGVSAPLPTQQMGNMQASTRV